MLLVVQNNRQSSDSLASHLRSSFRLLTASSIPDARSILTREKFDLVLLDLDFQETAGIEFFGQASSIPEIANVPIIAITQKNDPLFDFKILDIGAIDIIHKPVNIDVLKLKIQRYLDIFYQIQDLSKTVTDRTKGLVEVPGQIKASQKNIWLSEICTGVYWLEIPEAELSILCGCPPEIVKHMLLKGYIRNKKRLIGTGIESEEIAFESGANAILLSELNTQNGSPANATEFPVLQMLYRQGLFLPGHPNNTGEKALLIGTSKSVNSQFNYIHRGNYGLLSKEEMQETGLGKFTSEMLMEMKRYFAFGKLKKPSSYLQGVKTEGRKPVDIKSGVCISHIGLNRFRFHYQGETVDVDLNLSRNKKYPAPYTLDYRSIERHKFAVLHTGEGDGWDAHRPNMSSVIMWRGEIYLVDAPPNITQILRVLGIDMNEIVGVFNTHGHDDHFLGLCSLTGANRRLRYYATPLVRHAVSKKFEALFQGVKLEEYFKCLDLFLDEWNDINGLRVKPIFSPHPVENNIFIFEGRDPNGQIYRYGHWADLPSFANLDVMVEKNILPWEFVQKMKEDFLTPVDVKKIDIGGGMIHGIAEDYSLDNSAKIALAHISRDLTNREKEIGSTARFGSKDIFIPADAEYYREMAEQCLMRLFPYLDEDIWSSFYDYPIEKINAGTIVLKDKQKINDIGILLTGTAEWVHGGKSRELVYGDLIGESIFDGHMRSVGTWRALSDIRLMTVPILDFIQLLYERTVQNRIIQYFPVVQIMRRNRIFKDRVGLAYLFRVVDLAQGIVIPRTEVRTIDLEGGLLLFVQGRGKILQTGQTRDTGGYVSGQKVVEIKGASNEDCIVFHFPDEILKEIPIIQWRLREEMERYERLKWHAEETKKEPKNRHFPHAL